MHYFKRNIGDYHKKAGRLSMLEHGAYTLLLDACYDREKFPTIEDAIEWTWARSKEEIDAVKFVLSKFFTLEDGVYIQNRIKEELGAYKEKCNKNSEIAKEREEIKRTKRARNVQERAPDEHESAPNQEPLTINQETIETFLSPSSEGRPPNVPVQEILNAYHEILPELTSVQVMNDKRSKALRQRWREDKKRQNIAWWRKYFNYVKQSDFLMGRKIINGSQWSADFEWLIGASNLVKVIEGKYHHE